MISVFAVEDDNGNMSSPVEIPLPFLESPVDRTYPAPAKIAPNPNRIMIGGRVGLGGNSEEAKTAKELQPTRHKYGQTV